jgi:superfamily II DNA or RNA helicase
MEEHIQINGAYNLVICTKCERALTPGNGTIDHLRNKHQVAGTILKDIDDYLCLGQANNPQTIELPANWGPRQPVIPVQKGFKCRACPFVTISEKIANIHWRGAAHRLEGGRYTRVNVQTWMSGKYARYWTVGSQGYDQVSDINARDGAGNERSPSMLEQIVRRGAKRLHEANEQWRRAGQAEQGADYDNEFVKDMRWAEFSDGKDRAVIAAATVWINAKAMDGSAQEAQEEDVDLREELVLLCDSIKREVKRCSPRIHAVPKPIRQRLHGIETGKSNPIPFRMSSDADTLHKYSIVCQRYLCFCWRAYALGREEARSRLGMRFTEEQWGLLCDMKHAMQETDRNGADSDESTEGYDSDIDGYRQSSQSESRHTSNHGQLDGILFRFLIASIKTKVGGAMYTNALLCFFAATAIRQGGDGFQQVGVFTATVAAMLWMLRLFFLEDSFSDMPLNVDDISVEKMEWFSEQHAKWLSVDQFTVVGTMINWMAYGRGFRNKTMATPTVRWTNDYEALIHNGEHVRVHEFQRAAYRIKWKADQVMQTLFGGQWSTIGPNIDLHSIQDDMTYLGAGQSFATNQANAWLRSGPELAIKAAQSMLFDAGKNEWKSKGVTRWLSNLRQLKGLLMVGKHVWTGMPGRGPEVSTMRHCDGLQVMRNVFLYEGSVMIATDRDKAKSIRDMGRKVARFLPDDLGRIFVAYIAWLLPAEELLEEELKLPRTPRGNKEFMWRHGPSARWNTEKLSSLLTREIGAELGLRMGTARYRIVVIEMGRIVDGLVMEEMEKRIEGEARDGIEMDELSGEVLYIGGSWNIVWDLQSTHATKTARQHYAVHIGMPGHLHPMLIRRYHEISRLWHSFLEKGDPKKAWGKEWGRARGDSEDESNKKADVRDIKADSLAALRELEGKSATWRSAKQEECMHAIMQLEGERHLVCVLPTGAGKSILFMAPAMMRGRGTTIVVVPFSRLIDDMVKRTREKGVDVVHFRTNEVIAREALPYVPRLVIVSADVAVSENELFMAYMGKLDRGGHLQRIFIDEAHVTITDSSYREQLTKLKGLHRFRKPMIMLTATLMKTMERDFREMLLLPPETRIIRDRTTKKNARYEFVQVERKDGAVEKAAVQLMRRAQTSLMSHEKCIVYCKSVEDCQQIAEKLGCACHHSRMSDAHCQEAVARWLSGQGSAAMAATTGLGTGLDFRGIIVIVHSGIPYGLISFIQQTGRGARGEGEFVQCVVMYDGVKPFDRKGISGIELKDQHAMWTVATSPGCVREQIAMLMDGVLGECCADIPDAVPCCRCEPSFAFPSVGGETAATAGDDEDAFTEISAEEMGTHALASRIDAQDTRARGFAANASVFQEDYRQRARDEIIAKRWLDEVETKCAACFTKRLLDLDVDGEHGQGYGTEYEEGHEALGASCPARVRGTEPYRQMRRQLRFANHSCCFTCKLPLDWCTEAKNDRGTPDQCVYLDKVLPAIIVAAGSTREAQWIRDKFDIDPMDGQAFRQWLAGKRSFMDTRGTNMHMLWVMVLRRTFGHRMKADPTVDEQNV